MHAVPRRVEARTEVGEVTAALLAITGVLVVVAVALLAISFRRPDATPALAGMTLMIAASVPAVAYASLTS
jgi:hypothetical protein